MAASVTWRQALAWRMRRQLLDPPGDLPVERVVKRLCGVQTQVASSAELATRVRRTTSQPGDVAAALADGRIIKTWAMRGSLHLLTPPDGARFLALMASGRSWERPSWQRYFGVTPRHIEALRKAAREALDSGELTREELVAAVTARRGLKHIGEALGSGWGTLLKPLAWQGDLCFGPSRGNRVTFMRPETASPYWDGVPDADLAAPEAIVDYLRAFGPATAEAFGQWLSGGWFGKKQLKAWFASLGPRLAEVAVDGEQTFIVADDLDELRSTKPSQTVRLLPGFDQWVLGPGTADTHVIPAGRRAAVSRQSGWIAPVVTVGGVACGTWSLDDDVVAIEWFKEATERPRRAIEAEVGRLAAIVGRTLKATVRLV
jgi:hypothetical protein